MGYNDEWRTTRYTYDSRGRVVDTIQYDDPGRPGDPHPFRLRRGGQQDHSVYRYARGQHRRRGGHRLYLRPLRQAADDDRSDGADETNVYDATGLLTSKTDRNGNATAYTYDGAAAC